MIRVLFERYTFTIQQIHHRFYSVEVSLSLVAHLASSDPQLIATDPCSIHGGTNLLSFCRLIFLEESSPTFLAFCFSFPTGICYAIKYFPFSYSDGVI